MKNVLKGSIFYVIIAIIVVLGINYIRGNLVENTGVTYSQFQKYVAQNKVSGVEIRQNSQGVTGELTIHMKQGENLTLDVSDVTKAEELLDQKQIPYRVTVEKESIFMTTVLPMLLICVILWFFHDGQPSGDGRQCPDDEFWQKPCNPDHAGQQQSYV